VSRNLVSVVLVLSLAVPPGAFFAAAQEPGEARPPTAEAAPTPRIAEPGDPANLGPAAPDACDRTLPINLATALRLADARPLLIEAARAAEQTEYGLYEQARVLWLPTIYAGVDYERHDGAVQLHGSGLNEIGNRNNFLAGAGGQAIFAMTDAIFSPLAEKQLLRSRSFDIQTAKNDALLSAAEAYFDVQQARGILAGTRDTVTRGRELARRVADLGAGLAPPIEVERVTTLLADLQQQAATARQDWRISSANLTRVLRLDPSAVTVPLEPPHLRVTLIPPTACVDDLIIIGLTNRPELASQQAVVRATVLRIKQEKMRPLIPSLILQSNATPNGTLAGGLYGSGNDSLNQFAGRSDWDAQVVWQLQNLGFGNRALIKTRKGQQYQAMVELFRIQDQVAAEVAQAHAAVEGAAVRVEQAEKGLKSALESYKGNLRGLSETVRAGNLLQLVVRPQEAEAALSQLQQAYVNYYTTAADYNRAQFRLFRAMGYPAQELACGNGFGPVIPVDTTRPPQMAPVGAPEPCTNCPH
jgi:outer membrane protein TolC